MKRTYLKNLGVDESVIDSILEAHQDAVRAAIDKETKPLMDKNKELEAEAAKADAEIQAITDAYNNDQESYKAKFEALEKEHADVSAKYKAEAEAHAAAVKGYQTEKEHAALDGVVAGILKAGNDKVGGMLPDAIKDALNMPFYDRGSIKRSKDGNIENPDAIVELFAQHQPYLFAKSTQGGVDTGAVYNLNASQGYTLDSIAKMSAEDINNNWDAVATAVQSN